MPENVATNDLSFDVRWQKPLVPTEGGEATLLIRIVPAPRAVEGTRRAPIASTSIPRRSTSKRRMRRFPGQIRRR